MCHCTPEIRTPWCGKPGCQMPEQKPKFEIDNSIVEDYGKFDLLEETRQNIYQQQKEATDRHLFSWLQGKGYSFEKTKKGVEEFLKQRNFQLRVIPTSDNQGGTIYTYQLIKVIAETKLHLIVPKITIED